MMLHVWFMYDNHTFAKVQLAARDRMIERVVELFEEDGCGSLYVRDDMDATIRSLTLDGRCLNNGKYGVPFREIAAWVEKVTDEQAFHKLMCA